MCELLAPAGDLEKLKIAILYGADAVYIGGTRFSLRSRASNFTISDIKKATEFAHSFNKKVYVTCNIVMHESDTSDILKYLKDLEAAGVDGIIASSVAIIKLVATQTKMAAHVSTQTSILNSSSIKFYERLKAVRVVLGRELSLEEIEKIKEESSLELEIFIHGGMCSSYSGRCVLSNNMTNRDANRGGCAHSCRWKYTLYDGDKKLSADYFAMSSKDLCAITVLPKLLALDIASLKIEGRMKSLHYIACVVKAYRLLIDDYYANTLKDFSFYLNIINRAENRETSTGFLLGSLTKDEQLYDLDSAFPSKDFVGIVLDYDEKTRIATVEQRNFFVPHSSLEVFSPKAIFSIDVEEIYDEANNSLDACRHPRQIVHFYCPVSLDKSSLLRLN